MNESETRAELIDPALLAAGWGVIEGSRVRREYEIAPGRIQGFGKRGEKSKADYVLEFRNTKLAVIEAKAVDVDVSEGVAQAKRDAMKLALRFTFAANGKRIYRIDLESGNELFVDAFPSPQELWDLTFAAQNAWRDRFAAVESPDKSGSWSLRFYQEIAVNRVLDAIAENKKRVLLTLATGTGKTSIAFQIAWKLFQAKWNSDGEPTRRPRILFLADRNTLGNQAYSDFLSFSAFTEDALVRVDPDEIRKKGSVPKNASVFFTIFQTFMSGRAENGEPAPNFGDYPPDFFDFIIIDECHRGGANDESSWRGILEYFATATQLGLTATPKRRDNVDTYAYFGEPVFVYSLKDGINDGFLTPFRVKQIATTIDDYVYTPDDDVLEGEVETKKRYEEKDFNRTIEIAEREKYRVSLFMNMIDQREKTLVFCANQAHAAQVRDLINQVKKSKDPLYCVRVTANDGALGDQYLKDFRNNEKTIPTILTTSQKLSTGVDARNVRNIVLLRPVNSMIEFKQIIGRGTRLADGKDFFTIYDFVQAHHLFNDPEWDGEPLEPEAAVNPYAPRDPMDANVHRVEEPRAAYDANQRPAKVRIKLADGKFRLIQSMSATSYLDAQGRPMSAAQFLESLFGVLPELFKDEAELRKLWSAPDTRKQLLDGLREKGFGRDVFSEMQRLIDAENSDLFDVLAYVAFASSPISRSDRAQSARVATNHRFTDRQKEFIDFVLSHYVAQGVDELDSEKLSPLLRLKYNNAINDAFRDLGKPDEVRGMFFEFQKYLYEPIRSSETGAP